MSLIVIARSVGRNGINLVPDVVQIGAALVAIGPDRGGIFAPPLTVEGLGQAIEMFQKSQGLPERNGRVDRDSATLRRINEILNPGAMPPIPPAPAGTGNIRPMTNTSGLATVVDKGPWTPLEASLTSELGSPVESSEISCNGDGQSFVVMMNKIPKSSNMVFYFL